MFQALNQIIAICGLVGVSVGGWGGGGWVFDGILDSHIYLA